MNTFLDPREQGLRGKLGVIIVIELQEIVFPTANDLGEGPVVAQAGLDLHAILDAEHVEPLQAAATAVDPYLVVADATEADGDLVVRITKADTPQKEYGEVAVARFSGGASFEFVDRGRSIPITPVGSSA